MAIQKSVYINGVRALAETGNATGELAINVHRALQGVAGELDKHQLNMSEMAQLVDVLRQLNGVGKIEAVQILGDGQGVQVSAGKNVENYITEVDGNAKII